MAYKSFRRVIDYPYCGAFYRQKAEDLSKPLDQRDIDSELVWKTCCDIQEVSKAANPLLIATFSIFMPFDPNDEIPIERGMEFRGKMGNIEINGMVTNVVLSQVGGLVAYVKDYDSDSDTV